ncbi:MAG: hypothetical protein JF588_19920 [Caulobacterales bacterium]|nr:hypothetical protein [Caulobacterales bacterium]
MASMIVRRWARFESSLPEDLFEDEHGFTQPPGKSAADALAEVFRRMGCDVYYGPGPAAGLIWELGVQKAGRNFGARLNLIEDYWLLVENPSWLDKMLGRNSQIFLDILKGLASELTSDARFSNIRWFVSGSEANDGVGAREPIART